MKISERAIHAAEAAAMSFSTDEVPVPASELPEHERSIVELFRLAAAEYVKQQGASDIMDELKTTTLEKIKTRIIGQSLDGMADNKAERLAKVSADWEAYIREMVALRNAALQAKLHLEEIRVLERMQDRQSWLQRSEYKMGRSAT